MAEHNCGGCRGEGAHRRWCPQVVGFAASQYGRLAEQQEQIGDQIGANNPGLANQAYAIAGELTRMARWAKVNFQQQVADETRRLENLEGLGE